jgi:hypothetical protein
MADEITSQSRLSSGCVKPDEEESRMPSSLSFTHIMTQKLGHEGKNELTMSCCMSLLHTCKLFFKKRERRFLYDIVPALALQIVHYNQHTEK